MPKKKSETLTPVSRKIKSTRLERHLTHENLANETGFNADYLKEIESGEVTPPVGTLLQIARALKIDSGTLLREDETQVEKRVSAYTRRTTHYAYTTLTPGAENKHLKAFRVAIEAGKKHKGVGYHHEGEEFVYVLSGEMEITVGDHVNLLKTGESLHFNSGIRHNLKNTGDQAAELLVVIYHP